MYNYNHKKICSKIYQGYNIILPETHVRSYSESRILNFANVQFYLTIFIERL